MHFFNMLRITDIFSYKLPLILSINWPEAMVFLLHSSLFFKEFLYQLFIKHFTNCFGFLEGILIKTSNVSIVLVRESLFCIVLD